MLSKLLIFAASWDSKEEKVNLSLSLSLWSMHAKLLIFAASWDSKEELCRESELCSGSLSQPLLETELVLPGQLSEPVFTRATRFWRISFLLVPSWWNTRVFRSWGIWFLQRFLDRIQKFIIISSSSSSSSSSLFEIKHEHITIMFYTHTLQYQLSLTKKVKVIRFKLYNWEFVECHWLTSHVILSNILLE